MTETPEDAALIEAMFRAWYPDETGTDSLREAYDADMRAVLAVVRAHDAPTLATLTASLAEAEARGRRAEAALERLREGRG